VHGLSFVRVGAALTLVACASTSALAQAAGGSSLGSGPARPDLPVKLAPRPTTGSITTQDLMSRLYVFADDSMQGREAGTPGHVKGTEYIVRELTRLGVKPMGENGTYYQNVPMVNALEISESVVSAEGVTLKPGVDFHPFPGIEGIPFAMSASVQNAPLVFGGRLGAPDAIKPADAKGKLVVLLPPLGPNGQPVWQVFTAGDAVTSYREAAGLMLASFELTPPQIWAILGGIQDLRREGATEVLVPVVVVTRTAASQLLGANVDSAMVGAPGKTTTVSFGPSKAGLAAPTRNVVAAVEGSDPALKGQYIVLSAHSDHDGLTERSVDHDSLRLAHVIVRPLGAESQARPMSAVEYNTFKARLDSVRRRRAPRADSVMNGADDDGSGSMGLLEIAEFFQSMSVKPKRSILFVWNVAEEKGLYGSEWFTDNPTVPRDSMIANVNIDMIGRGAAYDIENGGPDYLQLLGSRRLSTEYGNWVEEVNGRPEFRFRLDYQFDADGHPQNYYCRSDHWNFARYSIPTVFFSTGSHADYHMPTDEPQYIDYPHYAKVVQFVAAVAADVAGRTARPLVDKPKPDPRGPCKQ
jgi:hypothetical protein